jgi:hypothetical protein
MSEPDIRVHPRTPRMTPLRTIALRLSEITRDPRRAEIVFGLSTAAAAALGALLLQVSPLLTAAFDTLAIACGIAWRRARRFNRARDEDASEPRPGEPDEN